MKDNKSNGDAQRTLRCAVYTRKSHRTNLALEFNSLSAQRQAVERFILGHAHEGWVLIEEDFSDGGFSGKDTNRPGWQKLMRWVAEGKVDVIVIYRLDRAFRSLKDYIHNMEGLLEQGVQLCSISEPFTNDSAFGRAMGYLLAILGQLERELTAERIRDNCAERLRLGKYVGGVAPYGYIVDRTNPNHKRLAIDPPAARNVRFIFMSYLECRRPTVIVDELAAQGRQMEYRRGEQSEVSSSRPFEVKDVRRILRNPTYSGVSYSQQTGETFPGEHPAIIKPELYAQVQEAIDGHRRAVATCNKASTEGLLKGIAFCGECNVHMRLTWGKNHGRKYRYYVCSKAVRKRHTDCSGRYFSADVLEQATFDYLRKVFRTPEVCAGVLRGIREEHARRLEELERQRNELNEKLVDRKRYISQHRLRSRDAGGSGASRKGEDELKALKQELATVDTDLHQLRSLQISDREVLESLENLDAVWEFLQPPLKARLVQLLLDSATIYDGKIKFRLRVSGIQSLVDELTQDRGVGSDGGHTGRD